MQIVRCTYTAIDADSSLLIDGVDGAYGAPWAPHQKCTGVNRIISRISVSRCRYYESIDGNFKFDFIYSCGRPRAAAALARTLLTPGLRLRRGLRRGLSRGLRRRRRALAGARRGDADLVVEFCLHRWKQT